MRRLPPSQTERLLRLDKTSSVCILRAMFPSMEALRYRFWIARTRKHSHLLRPGGISCPESGFSPGLAFAPFGAAAHFLFACFSFASRDSARRQFDRFAAC